jgi:hypothetical protein
MAGEIAPRDGMGLKIAPPLIVFDLFFSKGKAFPEKALTMSGADRFSRRGGTCRLHAIYLNQLCENMKIAGEIVKNGVGAPMVCPLRCGKVHQLLSPDRGPSGMARR